MFQFLVLIMNLFNVVAYRMAEKFGISKSTFNKFIHA